MEQLEQLTTLLKAKKNLILQGAPGTGKTYSTAALALSILEEPKMGAMERKDLMKIYNQKVAEKRIFFTTFHQSMDYEDFVEGLKPEIVRGDGGKSVGITYEVKDGIFKQVADSATEGKPVVLIIDEINRGNISKIFGELITLLEKDKRVGEDNAIIVTLPYSKEPFSVPSNLYIIGTMNTTDRSTGAVDYAIRRRFAFVTLMADEKLLEVEYPNSLQLFRAVQKFIEKQTTDTLDMDDLMIGHSYFMTKDLPMAWEYEIRPLLVEYYKDGLLKCLPKGKTIDEFIAKNQD